MPYYRRRRPYRRRRRFYRKKSNAKGIDMWSLAKKAATSMIKMYVNTEKKYTDNNVTGTISTTATIGSLSALSQGTSAITRVGDQVKFTNFMYNMICSQHPSATETSLRVLIGVDYQPNGAVPAATDVLEAATVVGLRDIGTGRRFHIFSDRVYNMSSSGTTRVHDTIFRKINIKTEYNGNLGTVADVSSNNLFYLIISDEATNSPTVQFQFRQRYIDN